MNTAENRLKPTDETNAIQPTLRLILNPIKPQAALKRNASTESPTTSPSPPHLPPSPPPAPPTSNLRWAERSRGSACPHRCGTGLQFLYTPGDLLGWALGFAGFKSSGLRDCYCLWFGAEAISEKQSSTSPVRLGVFRHSRKGEIPLSP